MSMAARMGDPTAHGGAIVGGMPTVLIGGMPAARMGDMHVCPMLTPGTPPIPHVGGPIVGGMPTILVGGMPIAKMGDMAICVGPPDSIVMGAPTVMVGAGAGGGGSTGAGGGASSATTAALTSAVMADLQPMTAEQEAESAEGEENFLSVAFIDKKKRPITGYFYSVDGGNEFSQSDFLRRKIQYNGIQEGDYEIALGGIVKSKWSTDKAEVGDTVQIEIGTIGIADGAPATVTVFVKDANFSDKKLERIETTVEGDEISLDFTFEMNEKYKEICDEKLKNGRYSSPLFLFKVEIGDMLEQSGMLSLMGWTEIVLEYSTGEIIPDTTVIVRTSTGEIQEVTSDSEGLIKIEGLPLSPVKVVDFVDEEE